MKQGKAICNPVKRANPTCYTYNTPKPGIFAGLMLAESGVRWSGGYEMGSLHLLLILKIHPPILGQTLGIAFIDSCDKILYNVEELQLNCPCFSIQAA
jgi:hypothetical protein